MADHLANIYGTEKDKVNCSFFMKIGACRHGEKCSKKHVRPSFSQVLLLPNLYQNPTLMGSNMLPSQLQQDYDLFYEDIFMELAKYGEILEMTVCDNVSDHLVGNVYIRYKYEDDASKAEKELNSRFYAGRPLYAELSPVSDFREACCRQYENSECTRGGMCNFMHLKPVSREVSDDLFKAQALSISILKPRPEEEEREKRLNTARGGPRSFERERQRERERVSRDGRDRGYREDRRGYKNDYQKSYYK